MMGTNVQLLGKYLPHIYFVRTPTSDQWRQWSLWAALQTARTGYYKRKLQKSLQSNQANLQFCLQTDLQRQYSSQIKRNTGKAMPGECEGWNHLWNRWGKLCLVVSHPEWVLQRRFLSEPRQCLLPNGRMKLSINRHKVWGLKGKITSISSYLWLYLPANKT